MSCFGQKAAMEKEKFLLACEWPSAWAAEETASSPSALAEFSAASAGSEGEECEDYTSGLAEQIARSMLEEDEECSGVSEPCLLEGSKAAWNVQKKSLPTSPQSTLAGIGGCNWDLSPATSSGSLSSGVSSPPTPVATSDAQGDDALDLLYAELLRLKMEDEIKASQQQHFQMLQQQQQQQYQQLLFKMRQATVPPSNLGSSDGYAKGKGFSLLSGCSPILKGPSSAGVSYQRSRAKNEEQNQVRGRKQVGAVWGGPALQQHHQSSCGSANGRQRSWGVTDNAQAHYHHLSFNSSQRQAMNGSGMRAVFLGSPGSRESGGTGVFLPRRIGSGPDIKRKPACSTVLLPSRIVQALNLNVEDTLACPISSPSATATRRDHFSAAPAWRRNYPIPIEKSDARDEWSPSLHLPSCSPLQEVAPDISLPTEWTY